MSWTVNSGFVAGLPDVGFHAKPASFYKTGELCLIVGNTATPVAFKWNGSAWQSNAALQTFSPAPANGGNPTIFEFNSELYLILGFWAGTFSGYKWSTSNNQWEQNNAIIAGLGTQGAGAHPYVFFMGSEMYMILGLYSGAFSGFKWNTSNSQWESNPGIITGLADNGALSSPTTFLDENNKLCLIAGFDSQTILSWRWNTSTLRWNLDATIKSGIVFDSPKLTFRPSSFIYDGLNRIIAGEYAGTFVSYNELVDTKVSSIAVTAQPDYTAKITIVLTQAIQGNIGVRCYLSNTSVGLANPANLVTLTSSDNVTFEATANIPDGSHYYIQAETYNTSTLAVINTKNSDAIFYFVAQQNTQTINITNAFNHITFNNPLLEHAYNHGLIFLNGFIYGSARNNWEFVGGGYTGQCLLKLKADDYSVVLQTIVYADTAHEIVISPFDQIVYCKGFLWCQGYRDLGYLVRINPTDLSYIVFNAPYHDQNQPIGTDGNSLYYTDNVSVNKLDTDLLLGSAASYGYIGNAVNLPANTILASCPIIQYHPTYDGYSHSFIADSKNIYLAITTAAGGALTNGYYDDFYFFHLQKIDREAMQTIGSVIIPKCTDDMVQNAEYIFLAPEYQTIPAPPEFGNKWGLLAVNKNTLEIKYLKALHGDLNTASVLDRQAFGVFYFNEKITVQLVNSKKTFVIDTTNVEQWGENFPIGGATDAIFKFQIDGVDLTVPCNELVLDDSGFVHTNTWERYTTIFKFNLNELTAQPNIPTIQTALISSNSNSAMFGGFVISEGQSPITSGGFKWGTDPEALTNDLPADPFSYEFQEALTGLDPGIYYVKAYGTNTEGTFFGNVVMFSTYNSVSLSYNNTIALLQLLNAHFGCFIRCVQDAPGIATGTVGTAIDQDGNVYDTVVINEKRWMVQNLKTTKFRNGDTIPNITDPALWAADEVGAWAVYNNKPANA